MVRIDEAFITAQVMAAVIQADMDLVRDRLLKVVRLREEGLPGGQPKEGEEEVNLHGR
jgi:hypothetical protein